MESNNKFSQEVPSESSAITASESDNSTDRELNDLDLEAIAGGMRTLTIEGPVPDYLKPRISMRLINHLQSHFGK
ncbi:hypothetical protein QUA70_12055 [Microcoleus sp. LAD1_D5]|uniref:hypothetical protein n=1 Tax=unclassified Microcoleus TaxID=2642155 RepID=UPI002FCFD5FB